MEVVPKMSFAVNDVTSSHTVHTTGKKKTLCQNNLHSNFLCPSHQLDRTRSHKLYQAFSKFMKIHAYVSNIQKQAFQIVVNLSSMLQARFGEYLIIKRDSSCFPLTTLSQFLAHIWTRRVSVTSSGHHSFFLLLRTFLQQLNSDVT